MRNRRKEGLFPDMPFMFQDWDIESEFQRMLDEMEDIMRSDFFSLFTCTAFMDSESSHTMPDIPWRESGPEEERPYRDRSTWQSERDDSALRESRRIPARKEITTPEDAPPGYTNPFVDVIEGTDGLTITAEMPGLSGLDDISVRVMDNRVQIRGEGERRRYFTEVPLDTDVRGKQVRKHYKNGILEIRFTEGKRLIESGTKVLKKVERALKEKRSRGKGKGGKGRQRVKVN